MNMFSDGNTTTIYYSVPELEEESYKVSKRGHSKSSHFRR